LDNFKCGFNFKEEREGRILIERRMACNNSLQLGAYEREKYFNKIFFIFFLFY